jgi:DNA uptake protein ComE-like DNA-binding protein
VKRLKSHFKFSKQDQSGIFFLLLLIILLHIGYSYLKDAPLEQRPALQWDAAAQTGLDALKAQTIRKDTLRIYPFNPNYITDYKGYTLGMGTDELDRLMAYRASGRFVNSAEEFQAVTQISDSLLNRISPYFKFPDWATSKRTSFKTASTPKSSAIKKEEAKKDLNGVTAFDLKKINGIGEVLSARIIKFRDRLGGFLIDDQLYDVYGLEKEVADRALAKYTVLEPPTIVRLNVNDATAAELSQLIYLQRVVAQRIVDYRNANGNLESWDDLIKIKDFPADKIDRIKLYLTLKK